MIYNLSISCREKLLKVINSLWGKGVCPKTWTHSIVIPLLKYEKPPDQPSSYRPICLTSVLCKTMERMIANRLRWFLESNDLLHPAQCGFRNKRSTKDCLMKLHDDIYKSISNRRFTVAVFLDIEKAYDMVWRTGLLYKMSKLGIKGNMLAWISSFLSDRTFQVRVGSTLSNVFSLENGIPQGSVLSSILFSIMINDLPEHIKSNINIFADDSCIWQFGLKLSEVTEKLQACLGNISKWCKTWGFDMSNGKSTAYIFTCRRKVPPVTLKISDASISKKK